ncbi:MULTISPECIES: bactofilin family protein [Shewanella]|uniref:Polymer-forming cytoskeletal protein n=1 Tax=Shewanella holmiensis TaxID=2952222 RepID=A0A9X2WJ75_9GAMM|nr:MULTISPECIES: polymer-forming cytoskeletal protein [Shewanella]MCT7940320.1 polymer-forming cytoskeletal protein [Shewanella holmiensis]MDP5146793.1 polymer-forming cytoskeletal protein [Shewanella sp. ULN5]
MFTQKKDSPQLSFIAQGCELTGDFNFNGDVMISGKILGDIFTQGNLVVEAGGEINGDIQCQDISITGLVKGTVQCQKLHISSTGLFEGDAYCEKLEVIDGGQFLGQRHRDAKLNIA